MTVQSGLREIVAGRTGLCRIDGAKGRLLYRGYDIAPLAEGASFEEVVHLLWAGEVAGREELARLRRRLASVRALPPGALDVLRRAHGASPMDVLRTAVSALAHDDSDVEDRTPPANLRKAERILSAAATAI